MSEKDVYSEIAARVQMPTSRWIPMILKTLISTMPASARLKFILVIGLKGFG